MQGRRSHSKFAVTRPATAKPPMFSLEPDREHSKMAPERASEPKHHISDAQPWGGCAAARDPQQFVRKTFGNPPRAAEREAAAIVPHNPPRAAERETAGEEEAPVRGDEADGREHKDTIERTASVQAETRGLHSREQVVQMPGIQQAALTHSTDAASAGGGNGSTGAVKLGLGLGNGSTGAVKSQRTVAGALHRGHVGNTAVSGHGHGDLGAQVISGHKNQAGPNLQRPTQCCTLHGSPAQRKGYVNQAFSVDALLAMAEHQEKQVKKTRRSPQMAEEQSNRRMRSAYI